MKNDCVWLVDMQLRTAVCGSPYPLFEFVTCDYTPGNDSTVQHIIVMLIHVPFTPNIASIETRNDPRLLAGRSQPESQQYRLGRADSPVLVCIHKSDYHGMRDLCLHVTYPSLTGTHVVFEPRVCGELMQAVQTLASPERKRRPDMSRLV